MPTGRAETHTGGICFFETHELERTTVAVITAQLPSGTAQMLPYPISMNRNGIRRNSMNVNIFIFSHVCEGLQQFPWTHKHAEMRISSAALYEATEVQEDKLISHVWIFPNQTIPDNEIYIYKQGLKPRMQYLEISGVLPTEVLEEL